jgi:hypothetical protein
MPENRRFEMNNIGVLTVDEVRSFLPDVMVKIEDKLYEGKTVGRNNPYATVTVKVPLVGFISYQYAWETILRSKIMGKPLTV